MNTLYQKIIEDNETAFYVFDMVELKRRVAYLRYSLPKQVELCYAVKANPFIAGEISDYVNRLEICSPGEAEVCFSLGVDKSKMVISGVYKTPSVIEKIVKDKSFNGIFTAESVSQWEMLTSLSKKYNRKLSVLLRLTNQSQFGMNKEEIEQIIAVRDAEPLTEIIGIQFFSGTQKTSVKKIRHEIEMLDEFISHLRDKYDYNVAELEYGPGFPVAYFKDEGFDEQTYLEEFSALITGMKNKPRIILELGRSIAASCGKYYTHIVDIKHNSGQNYLIVDGGMHHIVYFGQYMAMRQPGISAVGKNEINKEKTWNVCGSLCSMNDILAKQIYLPDVEVGDLLCFENTGAYCMTEGISLFLTREIPAIWFLKDNGEFMLVRKPLETAPFNTPSF